VKVLLLNIDSKLPNIALHKIAMWHNKMGDDVLWGSPMEIYNADRVYASCIFTKNKHKVENLLGLRSDIIVGGTGYDFLDSRGCGYNYNDEATCNSLWCEIGQTCLSGACQGGIDRDCSDAVPCTDDSCTVGIGCTYLNNNYDCGVCAICDGGECVYDEIQDYDCLDTSCPDGCDLNPDGIGYTWDYCDDVPNECVAKDTCSNNP